MSEILSDDIEDIAVGAGTLVLENGGETYRAEDTIVEIAKALGANNPSAFVTPTVVMFSYVDNEGKHHSFMRRIFKRGTNLSRIAQINSLTRKLIAEGTTSDPGEVRNLLHRIEKSAEYSKPLIVIMAALSSAFFTLMFAGSYKDAMCSFILGGVLRIILLLLNKTPIGTDNFMLSILSGAFLSVGADFMQLWSFSNDANLVLVGSIMQMVPGLALTNGIRDIIHGDLVSGGARLLDALVIALGLSVGSVTGVLVTRIL